MGSALWFGSFLEWFPVVFWWLLFFFAGFSYFAFLGKPVEGRGKARYRALALTAIGFRVVYAALLMAAQYSAWAQSDLTRSLRTSPLSQTLPIPLVQTFPKIFGSRGGYFIFYSLQRFWLSVLVSVGVAALFYLFLTSLKKYNGRFFEEGEIELGFLLALLVGWPRIIVFLPAAFGTVVLFSLVRGTLFKERYTTLGMPLLFGAAIALAFGNWLLSIAGLSAWGL